jgi:hypothetical protein
VLNSRVAIRTPSIDALRLLNGYRVFQIVAAACELKIPDLLVAGPKDAEELASATKTDRASLYRLLRGLAVWGFVQADAGGKFASTAVSEQFRSDVPGLRNMTLMLSDDSYQAWGDLLYTLRTGKPAYIKRYGKSHFEFLGDDPEASARFNAAMMEGTTLAARGFAADYDFSGVRTVVDVGGGNGALLMTILKAHPDTNGVLFDLAQGLDGARGQLASDGLGERVTLVEGSFFESVPEGGDLYVLKSIVHDWDDEQSLAILQTCRRATAPKARLVLLERVMPEKIQDSVPLVQGVMADLHMMVVLGGRERTSLEFSDLLERAGFQMTRVVPTAAGFSAVEAAPVG